MTTDITELTQSLKASAEKATPGQWMASYSLSDLLHTYVRCQTF
ncbi:hypothetical protein SB6408_04569 [Klebsiella spallanzanii]|uniref:Uncharacterized protein n=1 Tax=Klebsiella spallanzanii TaxID=2587528 RepID=A0A564JC68_9ENTR|nr:hypothetical protein SB6408_04569 [Klebsiella spallanzanii]